MYLFFKVFIIFYALLTEVYALSFYVSVSGDIETRKYNQKKTELEMVRSLKFCRGHYVSKISDPWECKKTNQSVEQCNNIVKCSFVKKGFNQLTESRRLVKDIKNLKKPKKKFDIKVSRKKIPFQEYKNEEFLNITPVKKTIPKKKKDDLKELEDELEDLEPIAEKKVKKEEVSTIDEDDDLYNFDEDTSDESEEISTKQNEKKSENKSKFILFAFELGLLKVSDDLNNDLTTLKFGWRPELQIGDTFAARLSLVGFQYKHPQIDDNSTFFIYSVGAFARLYFSDIFVEGGGGVEKWMATEISSSSWGYVSYGIGYRFSNEKFFKDIHINMKKIDDNSSTSVIDFGISFQF